MKKSVRRFKRHTFNRLQTITTYQSSYLFSIITVIFATVTNISLGFLHPCSLELRRKVAIHPSKQVVIRLHGPYLLRYFGAQLWICHILPDAM